MVLPGSCRGLPGGENFLGGLHFPGVRAIIKLLKTLVIPFVHKMARPRDRHPWGAMLWTGSLFSTVPAEPFADIIGNYTCCDRH